MKELPEPAGDGSSGGVAGATGTGHKSGKAGPAATTSPLAFGSDLAALLGMTDSGRLAPTVYTHLGDALAYLDVVGQGRDIRLSGAALQALSFGHRVAFLELWCGMMRLTMGVRAQGLLAPHGIDALYPFGRAYVRPE